MSASGPRLVALKCPGCQTPLVAHPGELLFACPRCPTAVEGGADGLTTLPLGFESGDRPWWSLAGRAKVRQFAATRAAETPFGDVAHPNQTLPVRFLIPADARPITEVYRAALDAVGHRPANGDRSGTVRGGVYSQRAAEQIARAIFLTLVARADGKVHNIEFDLELPDRSVLVRST